MKANNTLDKNDSTAPTERAVTWTCHTPLLPSTWGNHPGVKVFLTYYCCPYSCHTEVSLLLRWEHQSVVPPHCSQKKKQLPAYFGVFLPQIVCYLPSDLQVLFGAPPLNSGGFYPFKQQVSPFFSLLQHWWLPEAMGLATRLDDTWVGGNPMGAVKVLQFSFSRQALFLLTYLYSH